MVTLIRIIGIIIALLGIIFVFSPTTIKQLVAFMGRGRRLYWAGILRLLFGVILLLSASQCRLIGVIVVIGILFLVAGVMIFVLGLEKVRSVIEWWTKKPLILIRLLALGALAFGALIIYSA